MKAFAAFLLSWMFAFHAYGQLFFPPSIPTGGNTSCALSFNGISDFASSASLTLGAPAVVSINFWINAPSIGGSGDNLAFEYSTNYNSNSGAFISDPNSSGPDANSWDMGQKFGGASAGLSGYSVSPITTNAWHNVGAVYNGGNNTSGTPVLAYYDGSVQTPTNHSGTNNGTFGNYVLYLASRAGSSLFYAVKLARFAVWTTTLNSTDFANLALGAAPSTIEGGPIYYWLLNSTSANANMGSGGTAAMTPSGTTLVAGPSVFGSHCP